MSVGNAGYQPRHHLLTAHPATSLQYSTVQYSTDQMSVGNAGYQVFTPPPHYPSRHRNWQTQAPRNTSHRTQLTLSTHISVCISYRTHFWPALSCLHIILSLRPYSTLQNDNRWQLVQEQDTEIILPRPWHRYYWNSFRVSEWKSQQMRSMYNSRRRTLRSRFILISLHCV